MGSIAISQFADKLINACCGDKADALASKLPFKMTGGKDEDVDVTEVAEEKKEEDIPAPVVVEEKVESQPKKDGALFTDFEMKYELTVWKDLPAEVKAAAEEIGYDEAKWDAAEEVHVGHKPWHHLSESEIKAVKTLGWDEVSWEHQYDHTEWKDLPELQKRAATAAGYTELNWGAPPHEQPQNLEHKHWDELDEKDQQCMAVFGYTKKEWD
jgi:hypothetical protein